ncbi:hypothetical protein DPMN_050814 [Dreissena polymorpha]|uniref:Uncharacterized protein n=1 Tax=Dreissena polymorpha TaxID=45954 RepID=A0A9D4CIU0_DREPO|nr:hypothetical protein DPMN_050814 [Dreissena polymorpha]
MTTTPLSPSVEDPFLTCDSLMILTSWVAPAIIRDEDHVNSMTNTSTDLPMIGEKLDEVTSFNHLVVYLSMDGTSTAEVRKKIVQVLDKQFHHLPKYRLHTSIVVSIPLNGFETWTLHADTERMMHAFENKSQYQLSPTGERLTTKTVLKGTLEGGRPTHNRPD